MCLELFYQTFFSSSFCILKHIVFAGLQEELKASNAKNKHTSYISGEYSVDVVGESLIFIIPKQCLFECIILITITNIQRLTKLTYIFSNFFHTMLSLKSFTKIHFKKKVLDVKG